MKPPPRRTIQLPIILLRRTAAVAAFTLLAISCNNDPKPAEEQIAPKKVISEATAGPLFSQEEFVTTLRNFVPAVDTLDSVFRKKGVTMRNASRYTYLLNNYRPIWVTENGVTAAAAQLIGELDSLRGDGLEPSRYGYDELTGLIDKLKKGKSSIQDVVAFDTACTASYLKASHALLFGIVSPKTVDDQWFHANDTVWQAPQALAVTFFKDGKYPSLSAYKSNQPTYRLLKDELQRYTILSADENLKSFKSLVKGPATADSYAVAIIEKEIPWLQTNTSDSLSSKGQLVRGFQNFYGLAPTGKIDSSTARLLARQPDSTINLVKANLERLRWLPKDMENQYVLVNIPLMELFYRKGTENAFQMRVVVGKPSRQTPALNATMANVVFSPPWGVPPTILKKEVLPGIAKRGGSYLARKGLKAYDRRGKLVSASAINSKNLGGLSFRQPPGARNALGEIKFNLPNKWDIYLHDTPHKEDFPRRYRAKSSGCIRVEHPKDFAQFILSDLEGRNFNREIIDSIIQTRRTRFENLKNKIPVHLVYLTAFEDTTGQHLRFLPDIYKRDQKLIAALNN